MSELEADQRCFSCPFTTRCTFVAANIPLILSHLRAVHSSDPDFFATCGIDGCSSTLRSFRSLYQHIYRKHRNSGIITRRSDRLLETSTIDESCLDDWTETLGIVFFKN